MISERTKAMDDLIAQDADLIDTVVTDADREVFIRLSGPDDEGANRIRRGLTYTWEVGLIARHRQAAYAAGYQAAADRIEALEAEVEQLRDTPNHIWAEARDSEWDEGFNYAVKLFRAALAGDSHD